ncbi:hypothetical protein Leryth_026299 [Lithospermum erythrorhizon]|nr:hypothetical protein Leryth_026299 [Lithospermum erythrorhizon]
MIEASGSIGEIIGGKDGPLPASKASIEALRCVDVDEGFECSICLGEGLQDVNEMPCKHLFHSGCINKWLGIHGSCPICRVRMPVEVEGMGEGAAADAEDSQNEGGDRSVDPDSGLTSDMVIDSAN